MRLSHPTKLANFSRLYFKDMCVWFSYETPIAIYADGQTYVSINEWGPTTGKHINYVKREADVSLQIPHVEIIDIIRRETGS